MKISNDLDDYEEIKQRILRDDKQIVFRHPKVVIKGKTYHDITEYFNRFEDAKIHGCVHIFEK